MAAVPSPSNGPLRDAPERTASPNARFLAGAVQHGTDERPRFGNSIIGSAFAHLVGFLLTLFVVRNVPVTPPSADAVDHKTSDLVWLNVPGSGRPGNGAGDGKPVRPGTVERTTVAAATPTRLAHDPVKDVPIPDMEISIPAVDTSAGVVDLPGALTGLPGISAQGAVDGGTGMGTGPGGLGGIGDKGGIGDGPWGPGSGVTMPIVLTEVKPSYTAEAMRAKVQGAVMVAAIVREDGSVGQVRIVRSLDRTFGLDEEAVKAVRNWRFRPGKRQGKNVAVMVEIELTFTLR